MNAVPQHVEAEAVEAIRSRVPAEEYHALPGTSISRLKELKRSPKHYLHRLTTPKESAPLTLGTAAHCAVLEPERFERQFAVWTRRTDSGRMSPRNGKVWDDFCAKHSARTIITADEHEAAIAMQAAVRGDPVAAPYLESGDPEVTLQWRLGERPCRGRVDWLTSIDGEPTLVGLKTARDCRHFVFGSAAAKLCYHLQWAFYFDGYLTITGRKPHTVEIVVESTAPHAVAVYLIPDDIIEQGREEYAELLKILAECESTGEWPGPATQAQTLTLPSWVYEQHDDISDLGLEGFS